MYRSGKYLCKECGYISNSVGEYGNHIKTHIFKKIKFIKYCKKCGKSFEVIRTKNLRTNEISKGLKEERSYCNFCSHSKERSDSVKNKIRQSQLNFIALSKELGTFKYKKEKPKCTICNKSLSNLNTKTGLCKTCLNNTNEGKNILSLKQKNKKTGGYRIGSGRSRGGYYKNIYCHSTYELVYLIYCLDHNITIQKNTNKYFLYYYNNKELKYYPDFLQDEKYIEIKGYWNKCVDLKKESVIKEGFEYIILYKKDLKKHFEYVKFQYKTDKFYTLYDNHKPKYEYTCKQCNKIFESFYKRNENSAFCSRHCSGLHMGLQKQTMVG